jgi:hypothetical protein
METQTTTKTKTGMKAQTATVRKELRNFLKSQRRVTPPLNIDPNNVVATDVRTGTLDGKIINRLIIHLYSRGCSWVDQTGGCSMCGFYAGTSTSQHITKENYSLQLKNALKKYDMSEYPIVGIYNAGNLLSEKEVSTNALIEICSIIAQHSTIKRILVESKLEYIDVDKLQEMQRILGDIKIELGIGVETINEKIRDLCINKPFPNTLLEKKVELLRSIGVIPKTYLLFKPPFLTEQESIDDFVHTVKALRELGVTEIDCESMTIQKHTLVEELWNRDMYRVPWLWSLISMIDRTATQDYPPVYLTPFRYNVSAMDSPRNCDVCTDRVTDAIFDYQKGELEKDELLKLTCDCKQTWEAELAEHDERALEDRILDTLGLLNNTHLPTISN